MSQAEKAKIFQALHIKGDPVVLYNIWDAGSAKIVEQAGAQALATGSAPVASAQGYDDGENIPMGVVLGNATRIAANTDLPVTLDFEGGYAVEPDEIEANISKALETGVVGFNFEDQKVGGEGLYDLDEQLKRIEAVKRAIDSSGVDAYLNARTDIFLQNKPDTHSEAMVDEAIERARAFEQAGASGFFAPLLIDEKLIAKLCDAVALPVNILAMLSCPPKDTLASLGVARISYGPVAYRKLMVELTEHASAIYG